MIVQGSSEQIEILFIEHIKKLIKKSIKYAAKLRSWVLGFNFDLSSGSIKLGVCHLGVGEAVTAEALLWNPIPDSGDMGGTKLEEIIAVAFAAADDSIIEFSFQVLVQDAIN